MTLWLDAMNDGVPLEVRAWLSQPWRGVAWESLGAAGGLSGARFWRTSVAGGRWGLRCWPREHPSRERLAQIHRWLRLASSLVFLPQPLPGVDGCSWCETRDGLWELTAWMPGESAARLSADDARLVSAMRGVAELHAIWSRESTAGIVVSPAVRERRERLAALATGELEQLERVAAARGELPLRATGSTGCRALRAALPGLRARLEEVAAIDAGLQPCVRDLRPEHVLLEGEALTGIVDFGAARVDSVATDLARLVGGWFADDDRGWERARLAYGRESEVGDSGWQLARVLDVTGVGIAIANWLRWLWVEEREFEDRERIEVRLRQLIERLERLGGIDWSR